MRSILLVCLMSGACAAQPTSTDTPSSSPTPTTAPTSQPATGVNMSTDDLLDAMERVGTNLHTLTATVNMEAGSQTFGGRDIQNGAIWIERLPDGDTRGRVRFDDHTVGNKKTAERTEFLLAGDWVIQRNYGDPNDPNAEKKETQRQVRKPGDKTDLLKLGEGPFPLPIGQPRDRVKEQFEVNRLDDPQHADLIELELRPKESNRLSRRFESITVWVDPADALPRIVETVEADGSLVNTTTLANVKLNAGVTGADFALEPIDDKQWQIVRVPYGS